MLTRFIKTQLVIFTIASVVGLGLMVFNYLQAPVFLGIGRITVTLDLPAAGGLYPLGNVTYRGVQIGKVTDVKAVDARYAQATLSLDSTQKIPANLIAQVRSVSAVGEQYVDLQPVEQSPPYLHDGSVIGMGQSRIPQRVGPMLDQLSALVGTIPKDKLNSLLDESFTAFNGAGYDVGSLLDSSSRITGDLNGVADHTRALIDNSGPLLDGQAATTDSLKTWAHNLAGITGQIRQSDPQVRTLLHTGPGFADEVSALLNQVKPTLPVLLANLTTVGQVLVTYNKSVEQLLVLLPPYIGAIQSSTPVNNPTGDALGDFSITIADPPACTVGFLPRSAWRSPSDTTEVDTPDGLYCKLPQDSPIAVRGARNYPCIEHPGKRAATVQDCDSDKPFEPLATRQHALGPAPVDPSLIAQGVPPDSRVTNDDKIFGPLDGTPLPPAAAQPPGITPPTPTPPAEPAPASGAHPVAPSAYTNPPVQQAPVAIARYNPQTGSYMAPDGHLYAQSNLVATTAPKSWTDLVMTTG
ncbi:MCE family protein [Mycolicibacterium sp. ELW1]|uniref:MCE family protein n=1 Tax=Mycobacteriaceae TaxID=1762 RepID=UPI0011EE6B88|nr:MlaD family protein [Mycobacterium sp. ELW1]QEN15316.1 MCE family protein [Mycobacterium sp. ELW1]